MAEAYRGNQNPRGQGWLSPKPPILPYERTASKQATGSDQSTPTSKEFHTTFANERISSLEKEFTSLQGEIASLKEQQKLKGFFQIKRLNTYKLKVPLDSVLEPDGEGFIARSIDLPLYGYGDDTVEAVENLKFEIESLFKDLMEDEDFTEEWLRIKKFMIELIVD